MAWLQATAGKELATGVHDLGEGARVIVQSYEPGDVATARLENHHAFIDIQYITAGIEAIYWSKPLPGARHEAYDPAKDIEFFDVEDVPGATSMLLLREGAFAIFFPSDWHAPCIRPPAAAGGASGTVVKWVIKVPVDARVP